MRHFISLLFYFSLSSFIFISNAEARLPAEGIIGGDQAETDQFTYQVSLQNGNSNTCGGGIIADQFILTAAHCVIDELGKFRSKQLTAVAGVLDLNYDKGVKVEVERIYVPKEYKPINPNPNEPYRTTGDIAVLKLKNSLGLGKNPHLDKLELLKKSNFSYVGKEAIITGFGLNKITVVTDPNTGRRYETDGVSYNKLRFAVTDVIDNEECNRIYFNPIHDSNICARVRQRETNFSEGICSGDSGSPLVYNEKTVIGVVSTSPVGCQENVGPGIYTRVSSYLPFIKNALKENKTSDMRVATWGKKKVFFGLISVFEWVES